MKVLKLRFKNINSLKGEHLIDFTISPLSETGIFAIVGPTGAGKSTLLDVITLGLYGKVPRIDKSVTKAQVSAKGSIVTHHESEAWVEVTFKSKNIDYISSWSIRKTNRGTWADHNMQVSRTDGEILVDKKSEAAKFNEQLIGLNYEQFIKSILLSQGDFARFLKSNKNERGALLEDITGTHIYRDIGAATYQRYQKAKEEIKRAQERMQEIDIMPDEKLNELKNEVEALSKSIESYKNDANTLDCHIKKKMEIGKLNSQLASNKESKNQLVIDKQILENDLLRLEKHKKIAHHASDLKVYEDLLAQMRNLTSKLEHEQKQLHSAESEKIKAIEDLAVLANEVVSEQNFKSCMAILEEKVLAMDVDLNHLKKRGSEIRKTLQDEAGKESYPLTPKLKAGGDPMSLSLAIKARLSQLPKSTSNRDELFDSFQSLGQAFSVLSSIKRIKIEVDNDQLLIKKTTNNIAEISKGIDSREVEEQNLNTETKVLEEEIANLRDEKLKQAKIASLDDHRKSLENEEPCPLCGSTDHPYVDHQNLINYVKVDQALELKITSLASKKESFIQVGKYISRAKATLKHSMGEIEKLKVRVNKYHVDLEKLLSNLDVKYDYWRKADIELLEKDSSAMEKEIADLKNEIEALAETKYLNMCDNYMQKLVSVLTDYKELFSKRKAIYTGKEIKSETNPIQDRYTKSLSDIERHQHLINQFSIDVASSQSKMEAISKKVQTAMNRHGYKTITEISNDLLNDQALTRIAEEELTFQKRDASLQTESANIHLALSKIIEENHIKSLHINDLNSQLNTISRERDQLINQKGAKDQILKDHDIKVQKVASYKKEIDKFIDDFRKWALLNDMVGDSNGNKHANFAQELTLKNLIALTNTRLDTLTDRYLLAPPEHNEDLRVVDRYQGNITRSTSTLSGGETFIISLALALSLSDLASRNVRLESLFIDEGFGTLDHETLETALSTLENLQSESKKTIGVISHVTSLKDRLSTQIRLVKDNNGFSTLEVV